MVERIKVAMARQRLSITGLAEGSGVRYRTLQAWLLGQRRIPAAAVPQLAQALGCSTDWLLIGEGAVFDEEILVDYLDIIEQIRQMSNFTTGFSELAKLFERLYNKEYTNRRLVSRQDMRLLEDAIAELRRLRAGE